MTYLGSYGINNAYSWIIIQNDGVKIIVFKEVFYFFQYMIESAPKRSFGDKSPVFKNIYPQPKGWGKYLFIRVLRKFTYPVIYGGGLGNNDPSWGFPARPAGGKTPFWSGLMIYLGKNEL